MAGEEINMRKAKKITTRILLIILILLIKFPSSATAGLPLPVALLTGEAAGPIRLILTNPEVKKLSQFDQTRTGDLNKLIRHVGLALDIDGENTRTSILVDGNEAFSYLENIQNQRIWSFDPDAWDKIPEITSDDTDSFTYFVGPYLSGMNAAIEDGYLLFRAIREAFEDRVKTEKTDMYFKGFGRAVKREIILFSSEFVRDNFPAALADLHVSDTFRETLQSLSFSGSQKISLMYDEEGVLLRIGYDGNVGKTPETERKVSLLWKVKREENHQKDVINLKTPAVNGADKDNIAMERDVYTTDPANGIYHWEIEIDHRAGKEDKKATRFTAELAKKDVLISGIIEYNVRRNGNVLKTKIWPEIMEENTGEYLGTIEIADYSGKIERNRYLLHLQLLPGKSVIWPGGTAGEDGADWKNGTGNSPVDTAAGILIRKLFSLPEEDLVYFSRDIPEEMWNELIK